MVDRMAKGFGGFFFLRLTGNVAGEKTWSLKMQLARALPDERGGQV